MKEFEKQQEKEFAKLDRELPKDTLKPAFIGQDWECFKEGLVFDEAIKLEGQLREAGRSVRKEPRNELWDVYVRTRDTATEPVESKTLEEYLGATKPVPRAPSKFKTLDDYIQGSEGGNG